MAGYYPETKPKAELRLRPCLVLDVLKGATSGKLAVRVAYGTKNLKFVQRKRIDLIIQHHAHLREIGLPRATRFVLDPEAVIVLPWSTEYFGCWDGYPDPIIGRLTEDYIKEYAYCMMMRHNLD